MPPRKSASRKSDTTSARLVPMEDAVPREKTAIPIAPAPAPVLMTPVPPPILPLLGRTDKESESPKEKEKESQNQNQNQNQKEKEKEKEKDKSKDHNDSITIEDLTLPRSIITRLAKGVLPPNTQIQANAVLAISNSATMFISYLASHANENTVGAGKKTVTPADVFKALEETEFGFLREPLEAEFAKFNAIQTERRTSSKNKKIQAKKADGADTEMADSSHVEADGDTTMASEAPGPRAKRARVDPDAAPEVEDDAETEDEEPVPEDDEQDEVAEDEDEDEAEAGASGDDTHDALEEREGRDEADEALDGDESD